MHILLRPLGNSALKWGSLLSLCAVTIVLIRPSQLVYEPRIVHNACRSNIISYQRKRSDSFHTTSPFEFLQLTSRALVHSHHSSMKPQDTWNNFQHNIKSAPDALKEKRHCLLSVCFSRSFKSYSCTGQIETFYHPLGGSGPSYIHLVCIR